MVKSSTIFALEDLKEFDNHKSLTFFNDQKNDLRGFIAIHRGGNDQAAFGATRYWDYTSTTDALIDVLRLSKLMSYKAALAGLNHGGAKGVILGSISKNKKKTLQSYTQYVNSLGGCFITGADVGIDAKDLDVMLQSSKYIVGHKTDPVKYTALGVYYSIQLCLKELFGREDIEGRTFAIQGLGKTGIALLELLYKDAKKIYATDINQGQIKIAREKFPNIEIVPLAEIYKQNVDIYCPCALSDEVNSELLSSFCCKAIVGSANSQLEEEEIGWSLHKKGILYAPDYVVNAGGLISVVDEYENKTPNDKRVSLKVIKIKDTLKTIINKSKKENKPTNLVANEMAQNIFNKFI